MQMHTNLLFAPLPCFLVPVLSLFMFVRSFVPLLLSVSLLTCLPSTSCRLYVQPTPQLSSVVGVISLCLFLASGSASLCGLWLPDLSSVSDRRVGHLSPPHHPSAPQTSIPTTFQ